MNKFNPQDWIGRKFRCTETGNVLTIPDSVQARDFFPFGKQFIDVGDGYYSRQALGVEEIFEGQA